MKSSWFNGLEPDAKELMRGYFVGSSLLRERLSKLLEDKVRTRNKALITLESYDSPSWAHVQADGNGYERALLEVLELISDK